MLLSVYTCDPCDAHNSRAVILLFDRAETPPRQWPKCGNEVIPMPDGCLKCLPFPAINPLREDTPVNPNTNRRHPCMSILRIHVPSRYAVHLK